MNTAESIKLFWDELKLFDLMLVSQPMVLVVARMLTDGLEAEKVLAANLINKLTLGRSLIKKS